MSFFIIAESGDSIEQLCTPVVDCGTTENEAAMLVFLSKHAAEEYIAMTGWDDEFEVVRIEPTEMLKCLITARNCGISHVAIEPEWFEEINGEVEDFFVLEDPYRIHAALLRRLIDSVSAPLRN